MIQKDLVVGMLWCYTEKAVDNPMKFIQKALSLRKVDIFLAPEYLFLGKGMFTQERKLYSKRDYGAILESLVEESKKYPERLIIPGTIVWEDAGRMYRNTAPVLADGKVLLEYSKKDFCVSDNGYANFARTKKTPGEIKGTFGWRDMDAGIEICKDHEIKNTGVLKREGLSGLDLQIVIGRQTYIYGDSIVVDDGLVLCCDGGSVNGSKVRRITHPSGEIIQKNIPLFQGLYLAGSEMYDPNLYVWKC